MMSSVPETRVGGFAAAGVTGATLWSAAHWRSMRSLDWALSPVTPRPCGPLWARAIGTGGDAVVLLHGLISTGAVFGVAFDRIGATQRLVVPDLLGFGRSIDEERVSFGVGAHLDALDELADRTGLFDSRRWILGAHSMGVAVALHWAARHPDRVVRIIGWGAPIYPSPEHARRRVAGSPMARLFALDTEWAARACALSCRHRTAAGWLSVVADPRVPVAVARSVPLHTWPAYSAAVRQFALDVDWVSLVADAARHDIELGFVWGARDRVGDQAFTARLIRSSPAAWIDVLEHGDHRLPLSHPATCIAQLTASQPSGASRGHHLAED
jgi:pimeloyl-ACP methyl ester carboxylesterase